MLQEEGTIVKTDNGYNLTVNGELMFVNDYRRLKDLLMDLARNINENYEVRRLQNLVESVDIQYEDGLKFANIDVENLYNSFIMNEKGYFTMEELDEFKKFLNLDGTETKEELRAIRNTIVKYFSDVVDRDNVDFDIKLDQMSAFTGMLDYLMLSLNESLELTDEADPEEQLGDFYYGDTVDDLILGLDKITLGDSVGAHLYDLHGIQTDLTINFLDEDEYELVFDKEDITKRFDNLTKVELITKINDLVKQFGLVSIFEKALNFIKFGMTEEEKEQYIMLVEQIKKWHKFEDYVDYCLTQGYNIREIRPESITEEQKPFIIYAKAPGQKKFKAMDMNEGVQVNNLIYATLIYESKEKLEEYVKELNQTNEGWEFKFQQA